MPGKWRIKELGAYALTVFSVDRCAFRWQSISPLRHWYQKMQSMHGLSTEGSVRSLFSLVSVKFIFTMNSNQSQVCI